MDKATADKIKDLINKMTDTIREGYDVKIPVTDLTDLVKRLNGEIRYDKNVNAPGEIYKTSQGFVFIIRPDHDQTDIAELLGALFLPLYYPDKTKWTNIPEAQPLFQTIPSELYWQVQYFSYALFMPKSEYIEVLNKNTKDRIVDTAKVAEHFCVSKNTAYLYGYKSGLLEW